MTNDQIEAERVRFESRMTAKHGPLNFRKDCTEAYEAAWIHHEWKGWLARAEEQYASEAAKLKEIGIEFVPLDKKREEFNRLVDECRREERGE